MAWKIVFWVLCIWSAAIGSARASACIDAAKDAAASYNIPSEILIAITLTETGRGRNGQLEPWPWATNTYGSGVWHKNRQSAVESIERSLSRGMTNVDIGCFQLNYRWHNSAFASLQEMISPRANAEYAARFLTELYSETGSWREAAGLYHSRTLRHRLRYLARFDAVRKELNARPHTTPPRAPGALQWITFHTPGQTLLRPARPLFGAAE